MAWTATSRIASMMSMARTTSAEITRPTSDVRQAGLILVVAWAFLRPNPLFGALTGVTLPLLAMIYFASASFGFRPVRHDANPAFYKRNGPACAPGLAMCWKPDQFSTGRAQAMR